jgi:uncharacterized membrane protein (UPF0127 family)
VIDALRRLILVVFTLGVVAFLVRGATGPDDPALGAEGRRPLAGFHEAAFTITGPGGRVSEWCALLADTEKRREQGLMHQTDLRGYDGMVFRWTSPTTGRFYMFHTTIPLSIAWFDQRGAFVSSADMQPCRSSDPGACETFGAAGPYLHAIEARKGGLRSLNIRPGSRLAFGGDGCA